MIVLTVAVVIEMSGHVRVDVRVHVLVMDRGLENHCGAVGRNQQEVRALGGDKHCLAGLDGETCCLVKYLQLHGGFAGDAGVQDE